MAISLKRAGQSSQDYWTVFVRLLPESSFQGAAADSAIRRLCNEFRPTKSNEAELRPA
ncbi:hypothetical protein J6590_032754 [Homalodisca vitripennis]|nr:hypothetical protein J6590_032754 [Homalodisca vitripennis]